ncbi:hypothetical protein D917_06181, partial [Trichinella nativa]
PQCWKKQHRQVAQCHPFESVGAKECLLDDDESVMTDTTHQRVVVSKAFSEEEKFQAFVAQLNSLRDWQLAFFEFVRRSTGSRDAVESMLVELVRLVSYLKQLIVLVQSNEETLCDEEILKLKAFNSNALQTMLTEAQKMREECGFDVTSGKADFNFDENQAYSYTSFTDSPFGPADQPNDDSALWFTSALCSNWQLPICLALLTCLVIYVLEPPECCSYRNVWERSLALQMHYVGDGIPPT